MELQLVSYQEIDPVKWNRCIQKSKQGLIYAEYAYLQQMAPQWEALIAGDYEAVMPIACNKKWGIRYAYQPAFLQQTGIFASYPIDENLALQFLLALTNRFRFIEIHLPAYFHSITLLHGKFYTRNNYVLSLHAPYETTAATYNSNLRQRINKAKRNGLTYQQFNDPKKAINSYRELYQHKIKFSNADFERFSSLCDHYAKQDGLMIRGVVEESSNQLLACVLLLKDSKRIYNMASSLFPDGKKLLANYFLFDQLIEECSGKDWVLDFEGSDVPGIADFYARFPVQNEPYCLFRYNHLPLPFKWLKPRV